MTSALSDLPASPLPALPATLCNIVLHCTMPHSPQALVVTEESLAQESYGSSNETDASDSSDPDQEMSPAIQAAGHPGAQQGAGVFLKPTTDQEVAFYQQLATTQATKFKQFLEFVPQFMGTLTNAEMDEQLIVLEDLCKGFKMPSVLDVKLGSILWDSNATAEKRARLQNVSASTTSGSLGFRIAGMSVVQPDGSRKSYDKLFGREATETNIGNYLKQFFPQLDTDDYIYSTAEGILELLRQLNSTMKSQHLDLHSSSVLIIYEGHSESLQYKLENQDSLGPKQKILEVKLIDFAHTTFSDQPCNDIIRGISNLIETIEQLVA